MSKGGSFEREVSKALTIWLTGVEKPYMFWRMPGSGGLATIHEECRELSGDIRSLSRDGEFLTQAFSIECKTGYAKTSFWQHFKNLKNFGIKEFWKQAIHDAAKSGKSPMLIYRKKGKQIIVGITATDNAKLERSTALLRSLSAITLQFEQDIYRRPEDDGVLPTIVFYDFYQFLNIVEPVYIKEFMGYNE